MKQGYRFRAFTASYSWAARHFSADTFSCSETHHSTVSWRPVGWHPAMDTRACFCSNIEKSRHILDWIRTSISELSVRHSTIELHLQSEDNLFAVSVFLWSGIPESHRWLLHGKETSCCYTKPAISSIARWLLRTYLLLQQGILNHCCWSTHRILPPGIRLGRPSFCFWIMSAYDLLQLKLEWKLLVFHDEDQHIHLRNLHSIYCFVNHTILRMVLYEKLFH